MSRVSQPVMFRCLFSVAQSIFRVFTPIKVCLFNFIHRMFSEIIQFNVPTANYHSTQFGLVVYNSGLAWLYRRCIAIKRMTYDFTGFR